MANFDYTRAIELMRRVVGRRNSTDPLSTDAEFQQYLGEFLRDLMPQEMKNFENFDTYEFDTVADTEGYTFNIDNSGQPTLGDGSDIDGDEFENIGPVAYSDEILMRWYQDPVIFYDKWGFDTDVTTVQTAQPTDILFYKDQFVLKPQPDDTYRIRIFGFRRNPDVTDAVATGTIQAGSDNDIPENYWGRYVVYGASLDYMYDFGYDQNRIAMVEQRYKHYKALVHSRTFNQAKQKIPIPRF